MELIVINPVSAICFLLLLVPCSCWQHQLHSSNQQASEEKLLLCGALPRKLRVTQDQVTLKVQEGQRTTPVNHHEVSTSPSGMERPEAAEEGEKEEEEEGGEETEDAWQFLTRDYRFARRRRPIHNKSLPLQP